MYIQQQLQLTGRVQGVGMRPFVYRMATELGLLGWIKNHGHSVTVVLQGQQSVIDVFCTRLSVEQPLKAQIMACVRTDMAVESFAEFSICDSDIQISPLKAIPQEYAMCMECKAELLDTTSRYYRYPFISCGNCGPRYSYMTDIPYDRANTSMASFPFCTNCQYGYDHADDRRFHIEGFSCAKCGPVLSFYAVDQRQSITGDNGYIAAINELKSGKSLAVKGITGFHLMVDASNSEAIQRLRQAKQRPNKPFALLCLDIEQASRFCQVNEQEQQLLESDVAPIVLLRKKENNLLPEVIAPNNPYLGVMLASNPLHVLLCLDSGVPLIATSGNRSGEPICADNDDAMDELSPIVDGFLLHNRDIVQPLDDSIYQVIQGKPSVLRRARGLVPESFDCGVVENPGLAIGGHLKNSLALIESRQIFVCPYIADMNNEKSLQRHQQTAEHLQSLFKISNAQFIADFHSDYAPRLLAEQQGQKPFLVQHHFAHLFACMLEHQITDNAFGVIWDGNGLGADGQLWGGEFLRVSAGQQQRLAHFRAFRLPGGEQAMREPYRVAISLLSAMGVWQQAETFAPALTTFRNATVIAQLAQSGYRSPTTSSAGRLFEGVSALLGLCHNNSFEGEAAMLLQFAAMRSDDQLSYDFRLQETQPVVIDWQLIIEAIIVDLIADVSSETIARRFHNTMVAIIFAVAKLFNEKTILLSGGCFQNRLLLELVLQQADEKAITVLFHQQLPSNDGGLAAGQAAAYVYAQRHQKLIGQQQHGRPLCA